MDEQTQVAEAVVAKLRLLNPRTVRKDAEVEVDLGDGTFVLARKMDMTLLVFEGQVPMSMLTAVQRMVEMPDDSPPADRINALGGEGKPMVDLLRKHAAVVTIKPRVTFEESADPDVIPASYLNVQQLLAIWNATAVVPRFGHSDATRFRIGTGADDAPSAPTGENIPPSTEFVAPDGRVVEYIGQ